MRQRRRLHLILTLLILVTAACANGADSEPTSAAESPTTAMATTTLAAQATTASERLCQPGARSCPFPLAPGTHPTLNLIIPVTFEVPDGWSKPLDVPGSVNLNSADFPDALIGILPDWAIASQQECSREPEQGLGRSVDDLVTFLTEHPGLVTSTPTPATVGGLQGQVLDIRKDPNWSGPCPGRVNLFTHQSTINDPGWWDINNSMRFRLYILDAGDGHTVTVHVETGDEESFEDFVEAATPIVESLGFFSHIGRVTITESECAAELDTAPTTGELTFTVSNETTTAAAAEVFRLKEGHGFEVIEAHVKDERERADAGQGWAGPPVGQADFVSQGSGIMDADESKVVVFDGAEPGTYAIMCFRHHPNASGPVRLFAAIGPLEVQP